MGAAAALIPGIVGIAGGEYAGYKKRQKEAVDRADMGQFAKSLVESEQGPDPRLGGDVPNPMISANQLRARAAQRFPSYGEQVIKQDLEIRGRKQDAVSKEERDILAWMALHPGSNRIDAITGLSAATRGPSATKNPMASYDTKTGRPAFATPEQIAAEPDRYTPPPSGMSLAIGPDGQVMFTQGGGGKNGDGGFLTSKVESDIQTDYLLTQKGLDQLAGIRASYKPEYQQVLPRLQNWKTGLKSKAGMDVSDDERKAARSFAEYRQRSASFTNDKIRQLTGTAMGKDEAPRYMLQIPAAGSGLFDGDSPIDYEAKLNESYMGLENAQFRLAYALHLNNSGTPMSKEQMFAIPLDQMKSKMQEVGSQAAKEFKAKYPSATDAEVTAFATNKVTQIFGRK